jgi:hypothetical protein
VERLNDSTIHAESMRQKGYEVSFWNYLSSPTVASRNLKLLQQGVWLLKEKVASERISFV